MVQKKLRSAYYQYVEDIINPCNNDNPLEANKHFFSLLNHAKSDNTGVHPLKHNRTLISDPKGKALLVNTYFQSVFTRESPLSLKEHGHLVPAVLKELSTEIAPVLQKIYSKSIQTHIISTENYGPISLTCICSKLIGHIITSCIMSHLEAKNTLYPLQHALCENRSCESQLLEFITDLIDTPQNAKQTDVIAMDFSKAFDKSVTTGYC